MTPADFLRAVTALWGNHWQKPLLQALARRGLRYGRGQLWNWKKGNSPVPEFVELIVREEQKARETALLAAQ